MQFPQLSSGALSQYPIQKRHRRRTVANVAADGRSIKLPDPAGEVTEWRLEYSGLTDAEATAIREFFEAAEGRLNGFTFLDPSGNLLAWSDHLDNAVWQRGPLLSMVAGIGDPEGGTRAWHMVNDGAGPQTITQTLSVPSGYLYCLSIYVRVAEAATVTMIMGDGRAEREVARDWTRIIFAASAGASGDSVTFGLEIPAGVAADIFGLQVEPQAGASSYQSTSTGGIYENARFADDSLTISATGLNQNSCTVNITHAKHI